jgi:hypothetical protein
VRVGETPLAHTGLRCDRCGVEEHQAGVLNGAMSVLAEGAWAVDWGDGEGRPEAHLCPRCVRAGDLLAGYERNA